ncbi:unnamed protein product [Plutella xylostella]|uniref:(diamondback moth) hypothetical protein n=1 Tax=Plutella xylostella TaxID=51655 RepID=A0A8S4FMZ7_PLUXY|nr:unnamed protein product [Plutella xylostella]
MSRVEQHSRECNLELSCIPEFKNENLTSTVVQLASVVSCPIADTDIVTCKRVAKVNPSSERPLKCLRRRGCSVWYIGSLIRSTVDDELRAQGLGWTGAMAAAGDRTAWRTLVKNLCTTGVP